MADALDLLIARGPAPQDFSALGDLPKAYWEGLNQRHVQDLRDSFKGGVPLTPSGDIDYGAMQKTLYQKGGLTEGTAFGNLDMNRLGIEALNKVEGGGQAVTGSAPLVSPSTSRNIASSQPQSPTGYKGGDSGQGTVASLVGSKLPPDHPQAGVIIGNIAKSLGADPNAPLTPEQLDRATRLTDAYTARSVAPGGAVPVPQAPPAQVAQATPQAAPAAPYGPAATAETRGSVPTSNDPEIQEKIRKLTILAGSPNPAVAKAATTRLEALQKQAELTPLQKEYDLARRQGFTGTMQQYQIQTKGDETYAAENTKSYIEKYKGLQTAGDRARDDIPKLEIARKLTEDPNFYSGVGEQYNLLVKRGLAALGGDPNTAVPQEGFRKIVSDSLIDNIKGLAGSGAGAVRVAEIKIMQQAAASPDNTPQANRMLVEMGLRAQKRMAQIAEMAQNYNGGRLDAGFDRMVTAFRDKNPLFTPAEISDFRQIIDAGGAKKPPPAATTPAALQTFKTPADVRAAGLKPGTRFLDANGVERVVP